MVCLLGDYEDGMFIRRLLVCLLGDYEDVMSIRGLRRCYAY